VSRQIRRQALPHSDKPVYQAQFLPDTVLTVPGGERFSVGQRMDLANRQNRDLY
jgi:hypothetical protein